jgi:DNA replication protein DnaC
MSLQPERIAQLCELLKLPAIHAEWPACAQQAAREESSFADFLEAVLAAERAARTERVRHALLKLATLPAVKTLESYDFGSSAQVVIAEGYCVQRAVAVRTRGER